MDLITRLNKQGCKYEYIKLSDLKIDEKYKATNFEIINTKYGDRVSVILNNKYNLFLPNRLFKTISENLYEMSLDKWNLDEWYIQCKGSKILDNGFIYHFIEFQSNSPNRKNLLLQLNSQGLEYEHINLSDLNINKAYKINTFKMITTKYCNQISVILNNKYKLILPHRFNNIISQQDIDNYNNDYKEMSLIYKGKKNIDNGKTFHIIEFE